jgi:hypothetical protein
MKRHKMKSAAGRRTASNSLRSHPVGQHFVALADRLRAVKEDYVDVKQDVKTGTAKALVKTPPLPSPDQDALLLKSASRSMFGNKVFDITLNLPFTGSNTITTGVFALVRAVSVASSAEFNSCAALFEEYKIESGWVEFLYTGPATTGGTVTSDPSGGYLQVAYDPLNATVAPTSGLGLVSHEQRKAFVPPQLVITGAVTPQPVYDQGKMSRFDFRVPPGVLLNSSLSGQGSWVSVAAPVPFGGIEFYHLTNNAGAAVVMIGTIFMRTKFRNRF